MSIISAEFALFCLLTLFLYYTLFRRCQWILLLVASCVFYILIAKEQSWYILLSAFTIYGAARWIDALYADGDSTGRTKRKARFVLILALVVSLGLLAVSKYLNFILNSALQIISIFSDATIREVPFTLIAPIGISYYTFCVVGYLLDVYWKRIAAEKNPFKQLLFVMYFPQIIQGPIPRFRQLAPQFFTKKTFDYETFRDGLLLALLGIFKKLVIANRLSSVISVYFDQYANYSGSPYLFVLILYSFLIYADFSGAIDIVSGVSQMFGIKLMENFRQPLLARTIPEFWQRWHISMSSWFKDYVFFPVSISKLAKKINSFTKKRFGREAARKFTTILPLLVVWFLTGLWHGAGWNYIAWGLYYFVLFALGIFFAKPVEQLTERLNIKTECLSFRLFQVVRTFILCSLGRAFFRAPTLRAAFSILAGILGHNTIGYSTFLNTDMYITYAGIAILLLIDVLSLRESVLVRLKRLNIWLRWTIYFTLIFFILIYGEYGMGATNEVFAYARF